MASKRRFAPTRPARSRRELAGEFIRAMLSGEIKVKDSTFVRIGGRWFIDFEPINK